MHKGDTLIFYKDEETYYGTITLKKEEKIVFQSRHIDKLANLETTQFHLLSPVYGVVTGESKVYKLEHPFEDAAVIQVVNNLTQKRKDIRVETNLTAEIVGCTDLKANNPLASGNNSAVVKNISQNGLCIESDKHFSVGTILELQMTLFNS
ncbi:PilZ domain-containing protein [Alkaliphilus pronyensis]|uniref:PilZ domain-containing protein n=1 Tax=Alkaliphilus pronyensis TaxID=1482732 RepID=A0A6I0FQS4_9FIRM|nr:PilZ domain-containing protein [Alkaliphilus pronyensis]KAB3538624.1 PilZ domain-containing protein [Alkaliphilus pronyensis]